MTDKIISLMSLAIGFGIVFCLLRIRDILRTPNPKPGWKERPPEKSEPMTDEEFQKLMKGDDEK